MTTGNSIVDQQAFYDQRWAGFQHANRLKLQRCAAILDGLAKTKLREPKIIDLGCGAGWLTAALGLFGPATGVDLSDYAAREMAGRHPHVRYLSADVFSWPVPAGQFDVVVSQEVIEHVDDQRRYVDIAFELLRPGGYLLLTTPNAATFTAMTDEQLRSWGDQVIENRITIDELRRLLVRRFEVISLRTIIAGYGSSGAYRWASSKRLASYCDRIFGHGAYEAINGRLGYGLHLFAQAQKPEAAGTPDATR